MSGMRTIELDCDWKRRSSRTSSELDLPMRLVAVVAGWWWLSMLLRRRGVSKKGPPSLLGDASVWTEAGEGAFA